jgi:hypothetical protein
MEESPHELIFQSEITGLSGRGLYLKLQIMVKSQLPLITAA